jgi:uncharacterized protein (TIGR03118 family)
MSGIRRLAIAVIAVLVVMGTGRVASGHDHAYTQRVLAANRPEYADASTQIVDPLLVNPWGAAIRTAGLGGHFWLANQGSRTVTEYVGDVYDATGRFVPLFQDQLKVVAVAGSPVGQVFSGSATDFPVTGSLCADDSVPTCEPGAPSYVGEFTGPSRFIVNTEEGQIAAWTEGRVNTTFGRMRKFVTVIDNSAQGALYRGLAVTDFPSGNWLVAANFAQARVEVYDDRWHPITQVHNGADLITPFAKPRDIPADYVPFNVQYLGGHFYVAYAQLIKAGDPDFDPADPIAERACRGCGYVAVFNRRGAHLRTLQGERRLNAPWGLAIAPHNFGPFSSALLVGNFGDGTIVAFDLRTGDQLDYLRDTAGRRIAIDGLWALFFGNGASLGREDFLYFTAGPNGETDGIFGSLHYARPRSTSPGPRGSR